MVVSKWLGLPNGSSCSFRNLYLDHPPVESIVLMLVVVRLRLQVIKKKGANVSENSCPKRNILVDRWRDCCYRIPQCCGGWTNCPAPIHIPPNIKRLGVPPVSVQNDLVFFSVNVAFSDNWKWKTWEILQVHLDIFQFLLLLQWTMVVGKIFHYNDIVSIAIRLHWVMQFVYCFCVTLLFTEKVKSKHISNIRTWGIVDLNSCYCFWAENKPYNISQGIPIANTYLKLQHLTREQYWENWFTNKNKLMWKECFKNDTFKAILHMSKIKRE